jgi:hypothetical protein
VDIRRIRLPAFIHSVPFHKQMNRGDYDWLLKKRPMPN